MVRAPQATVLVVDDSKEWRLQIRQILQVRPQWKVIAEAGDGAEAVHKASDLQPDIILLDIGMPQLNGIEAAKIFHQKCPQSKILFVTQDGDVDIRNAALQVGALAYVLKTNVGNELLDAITKALYR